MNYIIIDGDRDCNGITVEIERSVRVGSIMRINPSQAYLGIEPGVITVEAIGDMTEIRGTQDVDIVEYMEEHYKVEVDNLDIEGYEQDREYKQKLDREPWVVYSYQSSGDTYVIPLGLFLDHISTY
jgi:hypothetical protein